METWVVTIEDRGGHDGAATGGHYGRWARIWASRPGIVTARMVEEKRLYQPGRLAYHHDKVVVEVELTADFDHQKDFLLVEHIARTPAWRASVPPPRWEDPKTAARVLVADPRGVREEAIAK